MARPWAAVVAMATLLGVVVSGDRIEVRRGEFRVSSCCATLFLPNGMELDDGTTQGGSGSRVFMTCGENQLIRCFF